MGGRCKVGAWTDSIPIHIGWEDPMGEYESLVVGAYRSMCVTSKKAGTYHELQ